MDFQQYFQSYDNYFWEWENEILTADSVFEALVIPGGNTIAYERYVMEVLELLSLDGLPPFGSLLLTIVATNSNSSESLAKVFEIIDRSKNVKKEKDYPKGFTYARNFLNTVAELPQEFKHGDNRMQLLQVIFKNCHNRVAHDTAKNIMLYYREHKHFLVESAKKIPLSEANLKKDIQTLAHLHVKYPTSSTLLAAIASIPTLPELDEKINEQQPALASSESFVDSLIYEPKTFPIGSLIHRIWSGLNIPLHHSAPSHQPLGGVSDLTNKGDFDKLLISEFANEDEVFMSRIANNEALYIKREVPPESDKFVRLLLIDSSLKNWGTPKILAFASALAIAKHPKTDIECKIIVMGDGYKEIAGETISDIIDGLDNLGSKLDVAAVFSEIMNENSDMEHSEVFLITSEHALASPDMQRTFSENHDKVKYIITAETQGNLNFYRIQNRGRKLIQHIYLPLEELWAKKPIGQSKLPSHIIAKGDTTPNEIYPLLLPPPKKRMAVFSLQKDEFYLLTGSGHLFKTHVALPEDQGQFVRIHKGVELVLSNLSVNQNGYYALQINEDDEYILSGFYPKEMYVCILNLNTRAYYKKKVILKGKAQEYSIFEDEGFYLFNASIGEYFNIYVGDGELTVDPVDIKNDLEKRYLNVKKRVERFEKSFVDNSILLNFMPLCLTQENYFQLNKHRLGINKPHPNYTTINLIGNRNFVASIEAVYEKIGNRFLFPDGSAVYRDGMGMLVFKSSDTKIPSIYVPTTLHVELAMATETCFTGNRGYCKESAGQEIISIEEFEVKYFQPFINTIIGHGV